MSNYTHHLHNLSEIDKTLPVAFVVGEFNHHYTSQLTEKNSATLRANGFRDISIFHVPGAFEIPGFIKRLLDTKKYGLIIALGVVIRGDTPHFDYVCSESARGLMNLTTQHSTPIINGILTCNTDEQVVARIGDACAVAGLNLLAEIAKIG